MEEKERLRVAFVDDDIGLRHLYQFIFKRNGIRCDVFEDPSGLETLVGQDINLIVSDGQMEHTTVYDTYVARDKYLPDVPVLCYTGNPSLASNLTREGKAVIVKPMYPDAFIGYVLGNCKR